MAVQALCAYLRWRQRLRGDALPHWKVDSRQGYLHTAPALQLDVIAKSWKPELASQRKLSLHWRLTGTGCWSTVQDSLTEASAGRTRAGALDVRWLADILRAVQWLFYNRMGLHVGLAQDIRDNTHRALKAHLRSGACRRARLAAAGGDAVHSAVAHAAAVGAPGRLGRVHPRACCAPHGAPRGGPHVILHPRTECGTVYARAV